MGSDAKENSDVKVNLAIQTYEMVDKHIRKLDADLARFEAEMKEAGGRLSQTESEGEEEVDKKQKLKKKKDRLKEERPKTPLAATTNGLNVSNTDIPVVDMPVDPNEPTYCLCQQVSYGEMIGCDNQDCPIEWFHFPCMALTAKPKGIGTVRNAFLCSKSKANKLFRSSHSAYILLSSYLYRVFWG